MPADDVIWWFLAVVDAGNKQGAAKTTESAIGIGANENDVVLAGVAKAKFRFEKHLRLAAFR